ncbi:MAG: nucleotide sugar dehydrogenase [Candidatus Bathyarchaeia archaeon]
MKNTKLWKKADASILEHETDFLENPVQSKPDSEAFDVRYGQQESLRNVLVERIRSGKIGISVFGAGYVGLPTAALLADAGFTVSAVDIKPSTVESIARGRSSINEPGLAEMISRNVKRGRLNAELLPNATLNAKDVIIITVQTPITKDNRPDLSFLMRAAEAIGPALRKGMLVAVCSTVPPGTLRKKVKPLLESLSDLKADSEFYLAYVPERLAPGKTLTEFVESPRLVGGIGPNSTKVAAELFRKVCHNVVETDATTAEISKTAENTFRDINIAFANQLALICEQHGADIAEVIAAANTHPRVKIHVPGPGVGGPCLTKDPYLLIHEAKTEGKDVVTAAREVNCSMPHHVVCMILRGLKHAGKSVENSRVAVLGAAYKANVDDARASPAEPIVKELVGMHADVVVFDPHCTATFGAKEAPSLSEAVAGSDCMAILTDHAEFANLPLQKIGKLMNRDPIVVDGKRMVDPKKAEATGFVYYGIGYGKHRFARSDEPVALQSASFYLTETPSALTQHVSSKTSP